MFCSNCGAQLADEANFCWKCGKQQGQVQQDSSPIQWETCDIQEDGKFEVNPLGLIPIVGFFVPAQKYNAKYMAKAVGTKGVFVVAETQWATGTRQDLEQVVGTLVTQLTKSGWEPTGRGEHWYNYKFRRRIKN